LPVFGKIQEIAVDVQLRKFCEKHDLFGRQQNGFRKCRSTTTALLTATINWRANRERKKYQGILLFDLSAAYDMLSKEIFLEKAAICGIKGAALKWLESYLTGRSQVVAIGEEV